MNVNELIGNAIFGCGHKALGKFEAYKDYLNILKGLKL